MSKGRRRRTSLLPETSLPFLSRFVLLGPSVD